MDGTLIDFFRGEQLPAEYMASALVEGLSDDAAELGLLGRARRWSMTSWADRAGRTASFATGSATTTYRSSSAR